MNKDKSLLVSIVIPTIGRAVELRRAVKSLLAQTYLNYEIIIVNDGTACLESFLEMSPRIRLFKNERLPGGNGARNMGVFKAKGDVIFFLDDDDEFTNDRLEKVVDYFVMRPHVDGVITSYYYKHRNRTVCMVPTSDLTLDSFLEGRVQFGASSNIVLRRRCFEQAGLWKEEGLRRHQDLEFMSRVLNSCMVERIDVPLLIVHGHNGCTPLSQIEEIKFNYINEIERNFGCERIPKIFYYKNYIELSKFFGSDRDIRKAKEYLIKANSYRNIKIQDVVKVLFRIVFKRL